MLTKFLIVIFMGLDLAPALWAELDTGGERSLENILGRNVDSGNERHYDVENENYNENTNLIRRPPVRTASQRDRPKTKLSSDGEGLIRSPKRRPKNPVGNLIRVDLANEDHKGLAVGVGIPVQSISGDNLGSVEWVPRKKPRKISSRIKRSGFKTRETVPKVTSDLGENPPPVFVAKLKKARPGKQKKKKKKIRTDKKKKGYQTPDSGDVDYQKSPDSPEPRKNDIETDSPEESSVNVNVNKNRNVIVEDYEDSYKREKVKKPASISGTNPEEGPSSAGLESPLILAGDESDEGGIGVEENQSDISSENELGGGLNSEALIELAKVKVEDELRDLEKSGEHRAKTKPVLEDSSSSSYEELPEDEEPTLSPVEYVQRTEKIFEPKKPAPVTEVVAVPVKISKPKAPAYKKKPKTVGKNKEEIQKLVGMLERKKPVEAEGEITRPENCAICDHFDPILSAFRYIPKLKTISKVKSRVESSSAYHYTIGDSSPNYPGIEYIDDSEAMTGNKYLTDHTGMDNVLAEIMRYIFGIRPAYGKVKLVNEERELHRQPYSDEDY